MANLMHGVEGALKWPVTEGKWMVKSTLHAGNDLIHGRFKEFGKDFQHSFGDHQRLIGENVLYPAFGKNKITKNSDAIAGVIVGGALAAGAGAGAGGGAAGSAGGGAGAGAGGASAGSAGAGAGGAGSSTGFWGSQGLTGADGGSAAAGSSSSSGSGMMSFLQNNGGMLSSMTGSGGQAQPNASGGTASLGGSGFQSYMSPTPFDDTEMKDITEPSEAPSAGALGGSFMASSQTPSFTGAPTSANTDINYSQPSAATTANQGTLNFKGQSGSDLVKEMNTAHDNASWTQKVGDWWGAKNAEEKSKVVGGGLGLAALVANNLSRRY